MSSHASVHSVIEPETVEALNSVDDDRGAGTSEGQGGAAFSKGTFNTVSTVITTNIAF